VDAPTPGRNQVGIRVVATTVTFSDCMIRGLFLRAPRRRRIPMQLAIGWKRPRRPILGIVLAGHVESVGRRVTSFRPGDRVFGMSRWGAGAYAEKVCWSARTLISIAPSNLSDEEAAAVPYGGLLAMHCLRKATLQPGHRVLIYGASGAIGTAAVQLAAHFGAIVTGVCSTANLPLVASLGAASVVDYTKEDFTSGNERYEFILDAVGKRKSSAAMKDAGRVLAPGGRCVSIDDDFPRLRQADLDLLKRLAEAGALKAVIDRRYPLEEIVDAHRYVELGHKKGNVIVTVAPAG